MKSFRKELWFEVPTRRAFINITPQDDRRRARSHAGHAHADLEGTRLVGVLIPPATGLFRPQPAPRDS